MRIRFLILVTSVFMFCSCSKEIQNGAETNIESVYDSRFEEYIGNPSSDQCWGDWTLYAASTSRSVSTDNSDTSKYMKVDYPSADEIINAINIMRCYYDGINMINIPPGDYWAVTIYKNEYKLYTNINYSIPWFKGYEKMSNINVYDYDRRKYVKIENIDSLTLIKGIEEYDSIMPQFSYFNELYSENYFDYRIIEKYGVYYIGFDFYVDGFINNDNLETYGKDCIYDDWVIMLIPAMKYGQEAVIAEKRIMCEDLSSESDFDFNDLVFDVAIVNIKDVIKTRITLQAVGTKSAISFLGREAHSLFGVQQGVCVNTGGTEGQVRSEPIMFYLDDIITDLNDIEISVFYDNKIYYLDAPIGNPTKKLCVNIETKWSAGGLGIWLSYPMFKEYVHDKNIEWEKNVKTELVFNQTY